MICDVERERVRAMKGCALVGHAKCKHNFYVTCRSQPNTINLNEVDGRMIE